MKKLRVFETFAGIGSQKKAFENIFNNSNIIKVNKLENKQYTIQYTSEWNINSIISYDLIHHWTQENYIIDYKNLGEENFLREYVNSFSFSKDWKTLYSKEKINKLPIADIKKLYIAMKRNNNLGSIIDIKWEQLKKIDLLTYSFPCQDLSNLWKWKWLKKWEKTRSWLLWEIERILIEIKDKWKLPKFLLMENIKAILQNNFINDFKDFEIFLEELWYKNTLISLNSKDFWIPQTRDRVFLISELNWKTNFSIQKTKDKVNLWNFLDLWNNLYKEEYDKSCPNDTPSRKKRINTNIKLSSNSDYVRTITTKQDRNPNSWHIEYINDNILKSNWRFLTPRECFLLMGFENKDFDILKENWISDSELYKQAWNSIVVKVLEQIFIEILKRF